MHLPQVPGLLYGRNHHLFSPIPFCAGLPHTHIQVHSLHSRLLTQILANRLQSFDFELRAFCYRTPKEVPLALAPMLHLRRNNRGLSAFAATHGEL